MDFIVESAKKRMNPMEAYKIMKQGKKCKGKFREDIWSIVENQLYAGESKITYIDLFMEDTFELIQEKKTLSDKIINNDGFIAPELLNIRVVDVKEALEQFLFWFDFKEWIESKPTQERIIQKATEIFGYALIPKKTEVKNESSN